MKFRRSVLAVATVAVGFAVFAKAWARPVWVPSYEEMTAKSDLVVIATPTAQHDLPGAVDMPGVLRGNDPIPAIEVETIFEIKAILHGTVDNHKSFSFVYYREKNPPPKDQPQVNAQALVAFKANSKKDYLMFLRRDADGHLSAFNGQTDPAFSIRELDAATP